MRAAYKSLEYAAHPCASVSGSGVFLQDALGTMWTLAGCANTPAHGAAASCTPEPSPPWLSIAQPDVGSKTAICSAADIVL